MVGNAGLHYWRDAQGLVNPREVEMHEVKRNRGFVILDLL